MKSRSYLFIVNPVAGNFKAKKVVPLLQNKLKEYAISYEIRYTSKKGEVPDILGDINQLSFDVVVAVGGDGTVNEVINCLVGSNKILGIIPCGTGNDLSKSLSIPSDTIEALNLLVSTDTTFVDIGKAGNYFFTNVASIGLDAEIANNANQMKKKLSGTKAYILALIKVLFSFSSFKIDIIYNGINIKKDIMLIAICNGSYYGGGMKIAPDASAVDGMLDICLIEKMSKLKLLFLFPSVYKGKHKKFREVLYFRTEKIIIKGCKNLVNLDGEIIKMELEDIDFSIGTKPLKMIIKDEKISILEESIRVDAPAS